MPSFVPVLLHCTGCADERPFVQPDCLDDHGGDCPEWMCLDCGAAILQSPAVAGAGRVADEGSLLARVAV